MRGIALVGDRKVAWVEVPDPAPGPNEVVIAVRASGLCGSDLHGYRAPAGPAGPAGLRCIAGHEPAGEVVALGEGASTWQVAVGQRVMVHHYAGCNICDYCRTGWTQMCPQLRLFGTDLNGGHAPYMVVPASTLVSLPNPLSYAAGAAISCGTGTAWGALQRLGELAGSTLIVFGQGPVGLSATMLAAALGVRVIAVDITDSRLARARELGAAATVNSATENLQEAILELTQGRGAAAAMETSGAGVAATGAMATVAPWGKVCFVGIGRDEVKFSVAELIRRQLSMSLSWSMSIVQQRACAKFIAERGLPIDTIFSHQWSLDQADEAYAEFDRQSAGKGVFVFPES